MKLYTYIIRHDSGLAPNPFWDVLTLNVCKPKIRAKAEEGDWIIGTGSKNVKRKDGRVVDFSGKLVFAMRVSKKITMQEYDDFCKKGLTKKIPYLNRRDWRIIIGDSIYDYSDGKPPKLRKIIHKEKDKLRDLSGKNTLISECFFYFGENAVDLRKIFPELIKESHAARGHTIIRQEVLVKEFEDWIFRNFEVNKLYGDPQLRWRVEKRLDGECYIECDD